MSLVRTARDSGAGTAPPGTYRVKCMDVRPDQLEPNPKFQTTGKVIRFDLEVVDQMGADGNPMTIDAIANDRLSPKSKLWSWLEAFGLKPSLDEDIDIEECIEREAMARVVAKPDSEFTKVDDLFALPATSATRRTAKRQDNGSNEPDYDQFWRDVRAMGKSNDDVVQLLPNKKLTDMADLKAHDLVILLEQVSA